MSGIHDDIATARTCGHLAKYETALDLEDVLQIAIARQQAGSQVNAVGGGAVGYSAFGTRNAVKAARELGLEIRKDRRLLLELGRRMVPPHLRRLPTATVPLVPSTSPMFVQNGVWMARFSGDWLLRRANRALSGRLPRERLAKTLELPREYQAAGPNFFLGTPWAVSGVFAIDGLAADFRATVSGRRIPMVPMEQYTAVRIDTLLAAASG